MNQKFIDFMRPRMSRPMAVAVSGGADSVCLLHWLYAIGVRPVVLHVNHGLRAAAAAEQEYVTRIARQMGLACHTFYWDAAHPASNLESAARDFRYAVMLNFCRENKIDDLLVAHHADDQIETFLMNLARGSGVVGLAGMRAVSVRDGVNIVRPLLDTPRSELRRYCDDNNIRYFHDEMNDDNQYLRVRMRQHRHVLSDMLGISDERILLAIKNLARTRDWMESSVENATAAVLRGHRAVFSDSFLFDLAPDIRLQFIASLIQKIGGGAYRPRLKSLDGALRNLEKNCQFTLGHCIIRRLGSRILIAPEGTKTSFRTRNESKNKAKQEQGF